ncbi:MAG: molybdopterin-guanine dinucleotide biosynthesis protein [Pseudomonadota bacterium]|jgi:molybdopterin-guanine dinucleotide biosynthesis protein B
MRVFGFAGLSNAGKTTLIEALIDRWVAQGLQLAVIKHAHQGFDIDRPGKDSWRHREAGASQVLISSGQRWVLMHECRDEPEPRLHTLIGQLSPCDLVLVEGYKRSRLPKLEVHREQTGHPWMFPDDEAIVGVACDSPPPATASRPEVFGLTDYDAIAAFVLKQALPVELLPSDS